MIRECKRCNGKGVVFDATCLFSPVLALFSEYRTQPCPICGGRGYTVVLTNHSEEGKGE